jgi:ribosomal protein L37AE/L43A
VGRKSKKQLAIELLEKLSKDDLKEVLGRFKLGSPSNSFESVENILKKECPRCSSTKIIKKSKNNIGLTIFVCKECGRKFNILSHTPLEKTKYEWNVWVSILEQMLKNQSIEKILAHLKASNIVDDINYSTVSMMEHKLRNSFIDFPLPNLKGVVQCDEKHFKESQKGFKNPIDVLDQNGVKRRKGRKRSVASIYGTMGPEFSTICCALDSDGHSIAKVLTMGRMELESFEDEIASHFKDVTFICSDMNPIYTQYASIYKVPQYVCNSEYHKVIKKCTTKAQRVAAYEQNKLDYVVGAGIMHYDKMINFRKTNKLTINGINGYHAELERYINHIAKGVSTKHLQAWVSFFNYRNNFRIDNGHSPSSYIDAERILIEILKLRNPIKVGDVKYKKDLTKKNTKRYTQKFITATVAARKKSNNPYLKFTEEDGIWVVDKRKSLTLLPEYKRRKLAKELGIRPFSPTSISSADLKKKLLEIPNLEDSLYILANGGLED